MLIEPLDLTTPIATFNGGVLVNRDMSVIERRVVPEELRRDSHPAPVQPKARDAHHSARRWHYRCHRFPVCGRPGWT